MEKIKEFIEQGRIEEALKLAKKEDISNLYGIGIELAEKKDPSVLKVFDKIVELNPNDAMGYYARGNIYCELNQQKKAINDYNKSIKVNPNYANAYSNRGAVYASLKQYSSAIKDCRMALKINPNDYKVRNNLETAQSMLHLRKRASINAKKNKVKTILHDIFKFLKIILHIKNKTRIILHDSLLHSILEFLILIGAIIFVIGGFILAVGNMSGAFLTFPFAGFVTMTIGLLILGSIFDRN